MRSVAVWNTRVLTASETGPSLRTRARTRVSRRRVHRTPSVGEAGVAGGGAGASGAGGSGRRAGAIAAGDGATTSAATALVGGGAVVASRNGDCSPYFLMWAFT